MKYFGTDGIRGIPNEKLNLALLTALGSSLKLLGNSGVLIGCDTRISKDMLFCGITAGALAAGLDVIHIGIVPTAALIYLSYKKKMTGIMITASHNPYQDNGIKIVNQGYKLTEKEETLLENSFGNLPLKNERIGQCFYDKSLVKEYHLFLSKHLCSSHKKIAIDCANGATYCVAPMLFSLITNQLIITGNEPDGYNINENVGSTHLEHLQKIVLRHQCDLGFAFDGDGDRLLCVDRKGNVVDGDVLIYGISKYLKEKNELHQNKVVLSIMSNLGIIHAFHHQNIDVVETKVGDKYIYEALTQEHLSIGGESSGHIILPNLLHTGDGILTAMFLLKILEETNTELEDWENEIHLYPHKVMNVSAKHKREILDDKQLQEKIKAYQEEFLNDCKIIVRASGTEDLLRVSVMASQEEFVEEALKDLVNLIFKLDKNYC